MGVNKFKMKKNEINLPSNKKFGFFFSFLFFIASLFSFFNENILLFNLFLFSGLIFLIITLFRPVKLKFLNQLWMNFGLILGKIINPIVLGLIYFLLITPIAIMMRLFGRDELKLKKIKKTYWLSRSEIKFDANTFKNQF